MSFCHIFYIRMVSFLHELNPWFFSCHPWKSVMTHFTFVWLFSFMNCCYVSFHVTLMRTAGIANFTFKCFSIIMNWWNMCIQIEHMSKTYVTNFTFECFFSFMNWYHVRFLVTLSRASKDLLIKIRTRTVVKLLLFLYEILWISLYNHKLHIWMVSFLHELKSCVFSCYPFENSCNYKFHLWTDLVCVFIDPFEYSCKPHIWMVSLLHELMSYVFWEHL